MAEDTDLQQSLWTQLASYIPVSEQAEVQRAIGLALLDRSEALHSELLSLLDVWVAVTHDREVEDMRHDHEKKPVGLAEPPEVRQRLISEIDFYLSHLSQDDPAANELEPAVAKHVREASLQGMSAANDQSRCSSAPTNERVPTARTGQRRAASARELGRNATPLREAVLATLADDNPTNSDAVGASRQADLPLPPCQVQNDPPRTASRSLDRIRVLFEQDCDGLEQDIEFLRQAIEGQHEQRSKLQAAAALHTPTLGELRKARKALESAFLRKGPPASAMTNTSLRPASASRSGAKKKLPSLPASEPSGVQQTNAAGPLCPRPPSSAPQSSAKRRVRSNKSKGTSLVSRSEAATTTSTNL